MKPTAGLNQISTTSLNELSSCDKLHGIELADPSHVTLINVLNPSVLIILKVENKLGRMESESLNAGGDPAAGNSFAVDARSLLMRFCRGEMFDGQFRKSEDVVSQLMNRRLANHFLNLEERVTALIDERFCHHFDRIEDLIVSKSCWMSPT